MSDLDTLGQDFSAELAKLVGHYEGNLPAYSNIQAQKNSVITNLRVISIAGAEGLFKSDVLKTPLALQDVTLPAGHSCGVRRSGPLADPVSYYVPPLSTAQFTKFMPSIKFVVMHGFGRTYDYARMRRTRAKVTTEASTFNVTDPATAYNAARFATGLQAYMTSATPAQTGMHHLLSLRGDLVNSTSWDSACTHVLSTGSKRNLPGINQKSIGINHEEWYYDNQGTGKLREIEDHGPYSEQQYVLDAFILKKLEVYTGDKYTHYLGHGAELKSNISSNTPGCFAHASGSNSLDPGAEFFLPPDFQLGISSAASVPLIKDLYGSDTAAWDRRFAIWYKNAARGEYISAYARIFAKAERLRSFDITTELFDPALKTLALDIKVPAVTGSSTLAVAQGFSQNKLLAVNRAQQAQAIPRKDIYTAARSTSTAAATAWSRNTANLSSITQRTSSEPPTILNALYLDPNTGEWRRADSTNPTPVISAIPPLSGGTTVSTSPRSVFDYGRADGFDRKLNMPISRDPLLLLPSFAERIQDLFNAMRSLGYDPVLHEGLRTAERAALLNERGTGTADSLHIYGAAVDITSKKDGYDNNDFFTALGAQAVALGLTWGGTFSNRVDKPHVQAIAGRDQTIVRRLAAVEREAFVRQKLA